MAILDPSTGVPIVGRARTWTEVQMVPWRQVHPAEFDPNANAKVAVSYPRGLWMCVVQGMRSDGLPCAVTVPIDGRMLDDPARVGQHLAGAFGVFHTYLTCDCREGRPCDTHQPLMRQPVSVPSGRVN